MSEKGKRKEEEGKQSAQPQGLTRAHARPKLFVGGAPKLPLLGTDIGSSCVAAGGETELSEHTWATFCTLSRGLGQTKEDKAKAK